MKRLGAIILIGLTGCTVTKYVPVENVRTEYVVQERERVDSVVMRDSVVTRPAGDTVYVEKYRTRERIRTIRDTVAVNKDVIKGVPYPVEKELTKWEKVKMDFGGVAMGVTAAIAAAALIWLWLKIKK